jgi:hypothetical protein
MSSKDEKDNNTCNIDLYIKIGLCMMITALVVYLVMREPADSDAPATSTKNSKTESTDFDMKKEAENLNKMLESI